MHLNKTRFMDRRVVYTQPTEQTASSLPLVFLYFLFFFFFILACRRSSLGLVSMIVIVKQ